MLLYSRAVTTHCWCKPMLKELEKLCKLFWVFCEGNVFLILSDLSVYLSCQFITTTPSVPVPMETWVIAECPARIDISGGWSDTPPITYERGGVVINAAILLDGKVVGISWNNLTLAMGSTDCQNRLLLFFLIVHFLFGTHTTHDFISWDNYLFMYCTLFLWCTIAWI